MKRPSLFVSAVIAAGMSAEAYAACSAQGCVGTISRVFPSSDGNVYLNIAPAPNALLACSQGAMPGHFRLQNDHLLFKEVYGLFLTSLAADKEVFVQADSAQSECVVDAAWINNNPTAVGGASTELVEVAGARQWGDGSMAASCADYRNPVAPYQYAGAIGTGLYNIDPDGSGPQQAETVTCDMTTDGGGWRLLTLTDAEKTLGTAIFEQAEQRLVLTPSYKTGSPSTDHSGSGYLSKPLVGVSQVKVTHTGGINQNCANVNWNMRFSIGGAGLDFDSDPYYPGWQSVNATVSSAINTSLADGSTSFSMNKGDYRIHVGVAGYDMCTKYTHTAQILVR